MHTQQFYFWKYYRTNRLQKLLENRKEELAEKKGEDPLDGGQTVELVGEQCDPKLSEKQTEENGLNKKRRQPG